MEQSYLRFSLEESIWFKKGQEVSELISISLDPVISVEEYEQYITIRGALELNGEYRMVEEEESDSSFTDFSAHRLVQRVTTREDGISELSHRFPVDITIPKNRIQNLDDVYVTVESFDYDLGENGRLLLMADITISGIYEEKQNEPIIENEKEEPVEWFKPFEVAARKEAYQEEIDELEEESEKEEPKEWFEPFEVVARKEAYQEEINELEEEVEALSAHEEREEHKEELAVEANITEAEQEKKAEIPVMQVELKSRKEEEEINLLEVVQEKKVETSTTQTKREDERPSLETVEQVNEKTEETEAPKMEQKEKKRNENALYLTKLFTKEQGEDFSRLKICIVQQGDSMDKIAERYDVTVQQLLRANHFDHETELREGQLLYIPVPAGSRA